MAVGDEAGVVKDFYLADGDGTGGEEVIGDTFIILEACFYLCVEYIFPGVGGVEFAAAGWAGVVRGDRMDFYVIFFTEGISACGDIVGGSDYLFEDRGIDFLEVGVALEDIGAIDDIAEEEDMDFFDISGFLFDVEAFLDGFEEVVYTLFSDIEVVYFAAGGFDGAHTFADMPVGDTEDSFFGVMGGGFSY